MTPQIAPHSLYVFIIWSSPSHPPEEKRRRHPIVELYPEIPTTLLLTYYSQAHTNSGEMSGNGTGWKRDCETRVPYYYSQCCMQKEEQTNVLTRFIARLIPLSGISFREIRGATPHLPPLHSTPVVVIIMRTAFPNEMNWNILQIPDPRAVSAIVGRCCCCETIVAKEIRVPPRHYHHRIDYLCIELCAQVR